MPAQAPGTGLRAGWTIAAPYEHVILTWLT